MDSSDSDPIVSQQDFIPFYTTDQPDDQLFNYPPPLKRTDSSTFQRFQFPSQLMTEQQMPFLFQNAPLQLPPPKANFQGYNRVRGRSRSPVRNQFYRDRSRSPLRQSKRDRSRSPRRYDRSGLLVQNQFYRDRSRSPRRQYQTRSSPSPAHLEDSKKINLILDRYKQLSHMLVNFDFQINQLIDEGLNVNQALFIYRLNKMTIKSSKKANPKVRKMKINCKTRTWGMGDSNSRI